MPTHRQPQPGRQHAATPCTWRVLSAGARTGGALVGLVALILSFGTPGFFAHIASTQALVWLSGAGVSLFAVCASTAAALGARQHRLLREQSLS
jgi:hypothetical protein